MKNLGKIIVEVGILESDEEANLMDWIKKTKRFVLSRNPKTNEVEVSAKSIKEIPSPIGVCVVLGIYEKTTK
jgi:hypothetical protein